MAGSHVNENTLYHSNPKPREKKRPWNQRVYEVNQIIFSLLSPLRFPWRLSRVLIDNNPSPASINITRVFHVLDTHSGVPYTPAHVPD